MPLPSHHGSVHQGPTHFALSDTASALAWLVTAGADALVSDTPRNWLAAPVTAPIAPPVVRTPIAPAQSKKHPGENPASALAAAAHSLAELDAAVAAYPHPLRRADTAPQLLTGNIASGIVVVTEHPDMPGAPATILAARMLAAIGLAPEDHARANLVPWPASRPPGEAEIAAFAPFLARAVVLAAPRAILAFGQHAAALSGEALGIAKARSQPLSFGSIPLHATFHPRILLTQPDLKRLAWADLQAFAARIPA